MELSSETISIVNMILSVAVPILIGLAVAGLGAWITKHTTIQFKALYRQVRPGLGMLEQAINEQSDPAILAISRYAPTLALWIVAVGPKIIELAQAELDKRAGMSASETYARLQQAAYGREPTPVQEPAPGQGFGAAK